MTDVPETNASSWRRFLERVSLALGIVDLQNSGSVPLHFNGLFSGDPGLASSSSLLFLHWPHKRRFGVKLQRLDVLLVILPTDDRLI